MPEQPEQTPLLQLGKAFNFSLDDLRANRNRRLTRRQRRVIWQSFLIAAFYWMLLLLVPGIIGWILVLWGGDEALSDILFSTAAAAGYATGIVLSGFYALAHYQTLLLVVDALRGHVVAVSGPVKRYGRYLYIEERRFLLETETLDLIQNGLRYTLYILPGSQRILSLEFSE